MKKIFKKIKSLFKDSNYFMLNGFFLYSFAGVFAMVVGDLVFGLILFSVFQVLLILLINWFYGIFKEHQELTKVLEKARKQDKLIKVVEQNK